MSGYDPGGSDSGAGRTPDLSSLQENFNQQQAKITALRELVRQTESAQGKKTASAQEKVKNIAQRLTQFKTKATRSRLSRASSSEVQPDLLATRINEESFDITGAEYEEQQHMSLPAMPSTVPIVRARSETPGSEKFNLLRQQMEQNRLKMAARESHKREMEERVIELKHKLESTQQTLERSVEFGRSTGDLTLLTPMKMGRFEFNKSTSDLTQLVGSGTSSNFDVERLHYLEGRVKVLEQELANKGTSLEKDNLVGELERKIFDLEETLKEKECIIEARTQAVSLMSENLSLKGKNTVDLLEDTKQEMYRMQTNFVQAEANMKAELDRLQLELDEKNSKISNQEEMNNILETARYDLTVENAGLKQKLEDVQDFSTKISELNKLNQSLQHRITELESQKYDFITDAEAEQAKFGESDVKYQELLDRIQELEEELSRKAAPEEDLLEKIRSLEATIDAQREEIENYKTQQAELQENLQEKTVELNVLNANFSVLQEKLKNAGPKPLFPKSAEEEAEVETSKLKQQLDEANKSMIKSKLKIKQLQKQVDSFKKTSAVHEEVVRLTEEVQTLTQRLAEVEEEKGNLQLHLVNYDGSLPDSELEKRIKILETTCQNQTTAIQLLEEQKLDINEDLNSTKHELQMLRDQVKEQQDQADQSGTVISHHMSSIETEEQLEKCLVDRGALTEQIQRLEEEKLELQQKLDQYMVENIELLDRIEKLSLEKVSSAESIEIVEGLTAKEKQEIECFEKASRLKQLAEAPCGVDEVDRDRPKAADMDDDEEEDKQRREEPTGDGEEGEDLNSSLVKLREESSELMHKIELFTNERREVLEKLEALAVENQGHMDELDRLRDEHRVLLEKHSTMESVEKEMKESLERAQKEKAALVGELEVARNLQVRLESEASSPSSSQSTPSKTAAAAIDKDSFEQALRSVDNEVTNYNKNKDKNKKLQISKKLSTDAKNLQKMANNLLEEYFRNVAECESMRTEVEQLKEKMQHLPAVDRSEEVNALKAQIMEITHAQIVKVEQIDQLREDLEKKDEEIEELKQTMEAVAAREAERLSDDEPELLKVELNSRNDEIRELKKELEVLGLRKAGEVEEVNAKLVAANKEIDILKELVAEQKQQLIETYQEHENDMAEKLKDIQNYENQAKKMKDQLEALTVKMAELGEKYSEDMKQQLDELKSVTQKQNEEIEHKQETIETLNSQIIELYKSMEENANKIIEKEDEVQYLQELLESKKDEIQMLYEKLTAGNQTVEDLRVQLHQALAAPVPVLDDPKLKELEQKNQALDAKNKEQLEKLKKFAANLKKKNAQCQELEDKVALLQKELDEQKEGASSDDLKEENEQLSQKMHHLNNELHKLLQHKYHLEAEHQTAQHAALELKESLQIKEQLTGKLEAKVQELEAQFSELSKTLETVRAEDASKAVKIEKCKAIIKEKNKEIQRLQEHERKTSYLQDEIKMAQSKLEDFHNQTMLLGRLKADKEELNEQLKVQMDEASQTQEKLRKLEVDLEISEDENRKLRNKIVKLEQGISLVEERRNSLERQKKLLGDKLEEKQQELTQHEDVLMQRLANLTQHDEAIENKLKEREEELLDLGGKLRDVEHQRDHLQTKLNDLEAQLVAVEEGSKRAAELENENYNLTQEIGVLQAEVKRVVAESEAKASVKDAEIDQLELDLTNQLTKIENERKQLQEKLERTQDSNTELQDELVRHQENANSLEQLRSDLEKEITWLRMQNESLSQDSNELQELRMQIVHDQTELENLRAQSDAMVQNHQFELNALRQQIADMEAIRTQLSQNQTDDQVSVQNEVIKLKERLEQKEAEVIQLQQRNLQLQMAASGPMDDPFSNLHPNPDQSETVALEEKIRDLENDATWKDSKIQELQIEKELADGHVEELRKQLQLLQQAMNKATESREAYEDQLAQKGSELVDLSKQLFATVQPRASTEHPAAVPTFSTAQFFAAAGDSSTVNLFDSAGDGWGWDEPVAVQQVSAVPPTEDLHTLREEIERLKAQNEAASKEVQELQSKLVSTVDRDDELYQLRDEIDILRAQNASLTQEVDESAIKLKTIAQSLLEEQLKAEQLTEQLQSKESAAAAPSVASFFAQSPAQGPVFEDLIVPKKAYLCTPSASEDREDWSVDEPAVVSNVAPAHHAARFESRWDERELENLREQNELQLKQLREQTEKLNDSAQQSARAQAMVDQMQTELSQLQQRYAQLEAHLKATLESHQKELEGKVAVIAEREDECVQLKDEIDIVRAQNASLTYELDEKTHKLKEVAQSLDEERMKVSQLEEQLHIKEAVVSTPSVASFFADSSAHGPVFEDLIVPKKAYLCTPSHSEEHDVDMTPAITATVSSSQEATGSVGHLTDREIENLREHNALLTEQIHQQTEQYSHAQSLVAQLQQRCAELEARLQQAQSEIESLHSHQSQLNCQHQEEQKKLKDELNQLKQRIQSLEQDRDAYLQLQDEMDILKAQNASLLQEVEEKADRIKRISHTLTEQETRVVDLEEQLTSRQLRATSTAPLSGNLQGQPNPMDAVFEEIIIPKKAFEVEPSSGNIQLEDDCWGANEAMLEEKHQQTSSVALERRLNEKDDYIRQLEMEKERLLQEIVDLKVKSGKLLKKVKEYKAKSDSLQRRSASMETSELDLAIQEELNSQIKSLEGRLNELQVERDKEAVEKDSLLKRIDVLVAANERFTEMKERQDVQMEIQVAKIKELNVKLQRLEDWGEESEPKAVEQSQGPLEGEDVGPLKVRIQELETEVRDLTVDNEELQALLDEEKANVEILEKRVQQKDHEIQELIEKIDDLSQDSRTIKSSLESLNQQKSQETEDLSVRLQQLMSKNTELTQQIEKMRAESLFQTSEQETKLQEQLQQLSAQLQYKEAEIVHLSERIEQQAKEDQTESLVQEILVKNQEISTLKNRVQQLQADRQEMEHNLTLQITKELASNRPDEKQPNPLTIELERQNQELREEKSQMEQELQVLNDQVLRSLEFEDRMKSTVLELDAKNIEIEALKASLEVMKQTNAAEGNADRSNSSEQSTSNNEEELRKQIQKLTKERSDLEANYRITLEQRDAHWSHVVEERGAQVAESWKQHVDLREAEFSDIEKSLREEIERLQGNGGVAAPPSGADPAVVQNMKEALEAQELEIVTLKEQLAIRSAEYARLAAQVDPFAVKHASNMVTSEPRSQPAVADGDKVPRSELELALYMIYQRDMRCEELELELRNLLSERDSLQLRLSNALRQHEEFKRKLIAVPGDPSGESASDASKTPTPEKSLQQIVQESGISAMAGATGSSLGDVSDLKNKLSELHSIDHGRDKRLQEERTERHRQMTLIQRDLAHMPLEAAAKIAGTDISQTESSTQQPQSASSVLINWILGKKTDS